MNKYTLQINPTTASPAWTYEVHMPSDQMALDYAAKIVANDFPGIRWFASLTVWKWTGDEVTSFVGTIRLSKATTSCDMETP